MNFRWLAYPLHFLHSRYAASTFRPTCANCPHWMPHGRVAFQTPFGKFDQVTHRTGICRQDEPRIINDNRAGYAFPVWMGEDTCHRHPLHDGETLDHGVIKYSPGDPRFEGTAGFHAFGVPGIPDFKRAQKLALGADVKPGEPVPPADTSRRPVEGEAPAEARASDADRWKPAPGQDIKFKM